MSGSVAGDASGEPPELDVLAGEYVLGVLAAEEMQTVRRQSRTDAALASAIQRWERDLLPLTLTVPAANPPEALWGRIAAAIAPLPQEPANDVGVAGVRASVATGPRGRVWPWQVSTALALALAAGLAAVAFLPHPPAVAERVATIGPVGAPPPAFLANAAADGHIVLTALSPADVPGGHDLELWVLPPGAQKVASLGVLPSGGRTVALPSLPATGTQLLVSLEPTGGSPTGQPTGPVLYAGTLNAH